MKTNQQQKKDILWYLIEAYDKADNNCLECDDIDCKKSRVYRYLKPKHQISVIDHKACLKQMKKQAKDILKLIMLPLFKDVRQEKCAICGKLMEFRTWKYNMKEINNKCFTMLLVCKRCYENEIKYNKNTKVKD